jgi:mitogen-activated protein kinase organizer 1
MTGSSDTTVRIWDTRSLTAKPIQTLDDAGDTVSSLAVHLPTSTIISGSYDGRIRSYDLRMGVLSVDVMGHPITSIRCSADGNTVLSSCLDGKIRLVDRGDGGVLKAFGGGQEGGDGNGQNAYRNKSLRIRSMFAKGDAVVVSGSEREDAEGGRGEQAMVFAWDVMSGDVIGTVPAGDGIKVVSCMAWNEKGKCWASGCSDGECIPRQASGGSPGQIC